MEKLKDVLLSDNYKLPHINVNTSTNFRKYLIDKLTSFKDDILGIKPFLTSTTDIVIFDSYFNKLLKYIASITESLNKYYNGFPDASYKIYSELLEDIKVIPGLLPTIIIGNSDFLYRIRKKDSPLVYGERKELFHVPFNLRTKIDNQRFSIAGIPCLYLSNSSYVAWEELRKPNLEELCFASFHLRSDTKFLDLSIERFYKSANNPQNKISDLLRLVVTFPLYFLSSIKLPRDGDPFKPEYIFPQFTLRWTRGQSSIDGICYSSTRINKNSRGTFFNLALPILFECNSGDIEPPFCSSLADKLKATMSIDLELLRKNHGLKSLVTTPRINIQSIYSSEMAGLMSYKDSIFYMIDQFLCNDNYDIITF